MSEKAVTQKELQEYAVKTFAKCLELMRTKGSDYSPGEDTFANFRFAARLGIVSSVVDSLLVRLSDKIARLANLTRPGASTAHESIEDTVQDAINYTLYVGLLMKKGGERQ